MNSQETNAVVTQNTEPFCNRQTFLARVAEALQAAKQVDTIGVIVLDMDRFQTINSALGHEFGYRVLERIADRLRKAFPNCRALCHLGNDEFAVLLQDLPKATLRTITHGALKAIRQSVEIDQQTILITASAGIATNSSATGITASDLLQQASIAATEAQRDGGNTCLFYTASVQHEPLRKLDLELDLRRALDTDQMRVWYQPIFDLKRKLICGLEALARWQHAELGWIEPKEFIPLAEQSGLIADIGEQVLHTACTETRELMQLSPSLEYLAVNFAARQIEHRNLVKITERILHRTKFPASSLVLEITESDFLESETRIVNSLDALRRNGVRVAIDDFGTGYSSLRVLKEFPADVLKIDRQFVQHAHEQHVDATITRAVIDIAHSLGLQVVAEGVETTAQLEFLRSVNCDFIQGYYVGKAVEITQLQELLQLTVDG